MGNQISFPDSLDLKIEKNMHDDSFILVLAWYHIERTKKKREKKKFWPSVGKVLT